MEKSVFCRKTHVLDESVYSSLDSSLFGLQDGEVMINEEGVSNFVPREPVAISCADDYSIISNALRNSNVVCRSRDIFDPVDMSAKCPDLFNN